MTKSSRLLLAAALVTPIGLHAAELTLAVATRTPEATVTTFSGLGTSDARAVGEFTAKAKRVQCEGYSTDETSIKACIADWNSQLAGIVAASANCPAGILFFRGGRYTYAGEWPDRTDGRPLTKWTGPDARIVTVAMASEAYPLDQNWTTLCPGVTPAVVETAELRTPTAARTATPTDLERAELGGRPWDHNGSVVYADLETGLIAYSEPKASIRSVVRSGTVLFRGQLHPDKPVRGVAYAYKDGCPPAPYPVQGSYSDHSNKLTLRGAGPVRNGCEVVAYSDRSPHALLRFSYLMDD